MTGREIQVEIGTLVLPSSSLAAATRAAADLQRELSALLARSPGEFDQGDRSANSGPGQESEFRAAAATGHPRDLAAAIHRAMVESSKGEAR